MWSGNSGWRKFTVHKFFWFYFLSLKVASTLVELEKTLSKKMPISEMQKTNRIEWLSELRTREQAKEAENDQKIREQLPDGRLNPLMVLKSLDSVLSDDTILVADGGDFVGSAAYIVRPRGPLQWYLVKFNSSIKIPISGWILVLLEHWASVLVLLSAPRRFIRTKMWSSFTGMAHLGENFNCI